MWGVAASFVLFDLVMVDALDVLESHPSIMGDVALSPATTRSTVCDVRPGEAAGDPRSSETIRSARAGAWQLGLSLGFDAAARQRSSISADLLRESANALTDQAADLQVPPPQVFVPKQLLMAHPEFTDFVEGDSSETAHRLAVRYSAEACHLYKLGAFWGYSSLYRIALPRERPTHGLEIRYHAQAAKLPVAMWQPMTAPAPEGDADQLKAATGDLTAGLTRYLAGAP